MICTVVGARPNFIKMAPIIHELNQREIPQLFVHTGQHYDEKMSTIFFDELNMPKPDVYLGVGSGSHADQTARIMIAFEKVCMDHSIELVIVAGDVNSTLACAIVASKLNIPIAHVEAGLRSFDRTMPEEINRILTDHISDLLFTTEPSGNENLLNEGIDTKKIYYVGNTMIDSLRTHLDRALKLEPWGKYDVHPENYIIVTLHRPANVDQPEVIHKIADALDEIGRSFPLLFPMHPRTRNRNPELWSKKHNIRIIEPLGYLEFLGLMANARVIVTDSGGIQEETTALGVPCITIRQNTERPVTITQGTNQLISSDYQSIVNAVHNASKTGNARIPELWDGHASERVVDVIEMWRAND